MATGRQKLGARGEEIAAWYLESQGYEIIARNVRVPQVGEIDIVAREGETLAIVEVRTRLGDRFGSPEESVGASKQRKLLLLGQVYVQETGWEGPWRVDFVAVRMHDAEHPADVRLYRDAVRYEF